MLWRFYPPYKSITGNVLLRWIFPFEVASGVIEFSGCFDKCLIWNEGVAIFNGVHISSSAQ